MLFDISLYQPFLPAEDPVEHALPVPAFRFLFLTDGVSDEQREKRTDEIVIDVVQSFEKRLRFLLRKRPPLKGGVGNHDLNKLLRLQRRKEQRLLPPKVFRDPLSCANKLLKERLCAKNGIVPFKYQQSQRAPITLGERAHPNAELLRVSLPVIGDDEVFFMSFQLLVRGREAGRVVVLFKPKHEPVLLFQPLLQLKREAALAHSAGAYYSPPAKVGAVRGEIEQAAKLIVAADKRGSLGRVQEAVRADRGLFRKTRAVILKPVGIGLHQKTLKDHPHGFVLYARGGRVEYGHYPVSREE